MTRRRIGRVIRWAAVGVLLLAALWLGSSWIVAYRLTHRAAAPFAEPAPAIDWGQVEPARLHTADGLEVGAWFIEGQSESPVVVMLHGNGGCRSGLLAEARWLHERGLAALLVTLRAHGDSEGEVNDLGYSARYDVAAAVAFARRRCPGRPVVVRGQSLGAAAAAFAAGTLGDNVAGYILECPYADLRSAVHNRTREYLPWGLEWLAYRGLVLVGPWVLDDADQIAPAGAIAAAPTSVPVLVIGAGRDARAPPGDVRAVYHAVAGHGRLVVIPEAAHLDFRGQAQTQYRQALAGFLDEVGASARRADTRPAG